MFMVFCSVETRRSNFLKMPGFCLVLIATLEVLNAGSLVYVPGGRFHILHALPTDVDAKTAQMVPGQNGNTSM